MSVVVREVLGQHLLSMGAIEVGRG
jgi:hypothetical protein